MKRIQRMKNKIAAKLSLYFALTLIIFSMTIGSLFVVIFKQHTLQVYKDSLLEHATSIAQTLSGYMGKGKGQYGRVGMGGYGAYLRFIYDIAGTNVWVIDREYTIVTSGMKQGEGAHPVLYEELPETVKPLIAKVFEGDTEWSEGFSKVLPEMNLTVGTPIKNATGEIVGIVLLHSSMDAMNEGIKAGINVLLISMGIGIVIVTIMAVGFSITFTTPLKKMKDMALQLAEGNYKVQADITQTDEIGELGKTLKVLAEQLELAEGERAKLDKLRNDFVANISHELKTPVTVMRGSLEALVDGVITEPIQIAAYHEQMLTETIFLQRLINDLLDLSKLQNTGFTIEKQKVALSELLQDVMRSALQIARKKEITITINNEMKNDIKNDIEECIIYGDYGRIRQMLMIIVDNAIKFSHHGGKVDIQLTDSLLRIKDYGIGISQEELPYIFEKFYKSRSEINKSGTGLGLAIAYQIAKRHDMAIKVESQEGQGASFIILLQNNHKEDALTCSS